MNYLFDIVHQLEAIVIEFLLSSFLLFIDWKSRDFNHSSIEHWWLYYLLILVWNGIICNSIDTVHRIFHKRFTVRASSHLNHGLVKVPQIPNLSVAIMHRPRHHS